MLCVVLAVPLAAYMALVAAPRARPVLVALVVTPLWASYLVKGYAWRVLLAPEGPLGGLSPGYGWVAVVLTLTYLWLPYMVLPIYAGIDGMRGSYVDAAADLGARPWTAFRTVMLPLLAPGGRRGLGVHVLARRSATTSPCSSSAAPTRCWATSCTPNFSTDLPFAAAVALLPLMVMAAYLLTIRRTGALERLVILSTHRPLAAAARRRGVLTFIYAPLALVLSTRSPRA